MHTQYVHRSLIDARIDDLRHAMHGHDPRCPRPPRRTAPRGCGGRFEFSAEVETAGIEPASAVAQKVASTSVSGALISSPARLAGRVAGDQPPELSPAQRRRASPGEPAF